MKPLQYIILIVFLCNAYMSSARTLISRNETATLTPGSTRGTNATTTPTSGSTRGTNATTTLTPSTKGTNLTTTLTPGSNATTTSTTKHLSTKHTPATHAPAKDLWQVKDQAGKLCMLMRFGGNVSFGDYFAPIPEKPDITHSTCNSTDASLNVDLSTTLQFTLKFKKVGSDYQHTEVDYLYQSGLHFSSGSLTTTFFTVPLGDYYNCTELNYLLGFEANLTNPIFQPFVQSTKTKQDLGDEWVCRNPTHSLGIFAFVGIALLSAIVVFVIVFVVVIACKKVKRRPDGYKTMN